MDTRQRLEAKVDSIVVNAKCINKYCAATQKHFGLDMSDYEMVQLVENKMQKLIKNEKNRHRPIIGFFRNLKDILTKDEILLDEMYSKKYNTENFIYNGIIFSGSILLAGYVVVEFFLGK